MAFRFSLATVLRLREIAEEREERLLGQILQQISQCVQGIAALGARREELIMHREAGLLEQMSAAELQTSYGQIRVIEDKQIQAKQQLAKLEICRLQQLKAYEIAYQNHELLSNMREEQLELYRREQTKQEQNTMDDNFVSRRRIR